MLIAVKANYIFDSFFSRLKAFKCTLVTSITCQSELHCDYSIEALHTSGICGLASVQEAVCQRQITALTLDTHTHTQTNGA